MTGKTLTLWQNRPIHIVDAHYAGGTLITDPSDSSGELFVVPADQLTTITEDAPPSREGLLRVCNEKWETAKQRCEAAKALILAPDPNTQVVEDVAARLGISVRTVYRDMRRAERDQRPSAFLPGKAGRPAGLRMLEPLVEVCIAKSLDEVYLKKNRPTVAQVCEEIRAACRQNGLPAPSANAIRRRIEAFDAYEVIKRRHGPKAARYKLKPMVGHVTAALPLDQVQIDHTPANVLLVSDDDLRREIGRPTLTMAIDICTRVILGFHISFDSPSSVTTALCLTHALLPKDEWMESIELDVSWPFFGKMKLIHSDNGADFHAEALRRGCAELGIEIQFRQIGSPHQGGHIERLMGTMSSLFTLLSGATQRDTRERGGKDAQTLPQMTLNEFRRWVANEVCNYHRRVHLGINCRPLERWNEAIAQGFTAPRVPDAWERLNTLTNFLPFEKRLIRRTGIQLWDIHYWAAGLDEWVATPKKREIFYDPRDISVVYLRGPDGSVLEAHPTRDDIPKVSLAEWRHERARQRAGGSPKARQEYDEGLARRRAMINESARKTRAAHRNSSKQAETQRDVAVDKPVAPPANEPTISPIRQKFAAETWSAP
jgi:putative transposase